MARLRSGFAVAALLSLISSPAHAAEFSLGGYYRMRLELFKSLNAGVGLEGVPEDRTTGYWQHRVRLDPRIKLNDNISFYAQIDLLDNVIAGDYPDIQTSFGNALPEFLSQGTRPRTGDASDRNFAVKRAWGEVLTTVGLLKFGRMGSHWGLGILANDGNAWDDDTGDTVDRIMFVTKVGPIYFVPMVDKVAESAFFETGSDPVDVGDASLNYGSDDVDQFILVARYNGEVTSAGVYGVYRIQPATDTTVYIADVWGKTKIGPIAVEAEGAYLQGETLNFIPPNSPTHLDINQWGFAVETSVPLNRITPGFSFGAASGDDQDGPSDGDIDNFSFDRNYRPAFLLFRYIHVLDAPKAISNAAYAKPNVRWEIFDNFTVDAGVIYAQTLAEAATYDSGPYGTELDIGATWRMYDDFEAGVRYGVLSPGRALKPSTSTDKLDTFVHGLEGRFLIRF